MTSDLLSAWNSMMHATVFLKKRAFLCFSISSVLLLMFIWFLNSQARLLLFVSKYNELGFQKNAPLHTDHFTNDLHTFDKFKTLCFNGRQPESIEDLTSFVKMLSTSQDHFCQDQHQMFINIYQIRIKYTNIKISSAFMLKVKSWLNNDPNLIEAAKNQSIIFIDNLYSQESVVFNPVRANRPGTGSGNTKAYVEELVSKTANECDFCRYEDFTAADSFGHMESSHSIIISNTFKIERYHGMVLFRQHDPINFSQFQYIDSMYLAFKWFQKTHSLVPSHEYRIMYHDILPKASASQVHPHIHLTLGDYAYYSKWNILHKASQLFSMQHQQKNYWTTLLQLHSALGLTVRFGDASVMAYLTPQKDFEIFVIAQKPCLDFFRLMFYTIRAFMDDLGQYALSMGYVFPRLHTNYRYGDELPMMARIVSRGPADNSRSDISSFDLFGTGNVNKDPFKVIQVIRQSVETKGAENFLYADWEDFE